MAAVVHHYFPLGSDNVGDALVARALRHEFVRHFGPCEFVDMPANDRYRGTDRPAGLVGANVARSNAEADWVLVGGSNMLEPRKPRRDAGPDEPHWGVFTDVESLRALRVPLVSAGMGSGSGFGKAVRPYHPRAAEEIRTFFARATAASVRDVTTVDALARIGVRTECTACPVTFLTDRPVTPQSGSRPLLVSFPPSRIVKRFFGRRFMAGAMQYVRRLERRGVPVVVTLHEARDREITRDWIPAGTEVFHTDRLDELIERFDDSCGVVGFRLHAALLGLGLGKPVIPVGVDWRGLGFIRTFALDDLSIRPLRFGQFAKLDRLTERLLAGDAELCDRLSAGKRAYYERYQAFFRRAAATAQARRAA